MAKTVVIFLVVLSLWNIADANTGESLDLRIYDRDLHVSNSQVRMMLDKAALEEHGFKLEITSKLVSESGSGSDKPAYQKTYFYYKIVDCAQVPEISEQLESLIPGVFGGKILAEIGIEIRNRNLDNLNQCKTGLEVHFKEAEGCYGNRKARALRDHCDKCLWCSRSKVVLDN